MATAQEQEAADPGPEAAGAAFVPPGPEPGAVAAASAPRRRRRTGLLFGLAVLLGVVGGAGTGYGVQASRPPTSLPPLTVPQPAYPSARASVPALTAAEDDMVRTDGDLTTLLLPVPKGSKLADDIQGWESLSEYAQNFDRPGDAFRHQLELGFRRAAHRSWRTGDVFVNVELSQYQHAAEDSADSYVTDQLGFAADRGGDPGGSAIPGYPSGRAYAGKKAQHADDGSVFYESRALAYHGDIVVDVFVVSPRPISAQTGIGIIESQLERL